jgi:hypothetical protein
MREKVTLSLTNGGTDNVKQAYMYQDNYHDITGVILVGGKGRRMGRDKVFCPLPARHPSNEFWRH